MKWLTDQYDRLYKQVKEGKRVVCYLDYHFPDTDFIYRDIANVIISKDMLIGAVVRGHMFFGVRDGEDQQIRFLIECESLNVQWLDESEEDNTTSAMNIVNQLFDLAGISADKRQQLNDVADKFINDNFIIHKR